MSEHGESALPRESSSWPDKLVRTGSVLGWVVIAGLLAAVAARVLFHDGLLPLVWINSFTQYVYLPAYVVLALALWARQRKLAVAAILVIGFHLWWIAPDWQSAESLPAWADQTKPIRIASANLRKFNPRMEELCDELLDAEPDVLVLIELRADDLRWFKARRFRQTFPYELALPSTGSSGLGIYSRYPLRATSIVRVDRVPLLEATIDRPSGPLRLLAVHPHPPRTRATFATWNRYWQTVLERLTPVRGPTVVIGDFNMTQHAALYTRLLQQGLRSAHVAHGRGTATTWPNGHRWLPPIRIDHALISRQVACLNIREGAGYGSDHRPIIVDLAVE